MSAEFVIDEIHRTVFSHGSGVLTYSDITSHMDRLTANSRFQADFNQIIDFTDVSHLALSVEQIHLLARRNIFGPKSRRAYVVASDLHYGLARMFASLRDSEGEPGIIPFRDLASAVIWADVPLEIARKAFAGLRQQQTPA